jgi:hypothetical protein
MERFLRAKHWQLFLLLFGVPMIFQFFIFGSLIASIGAGHNPDPSFMFNYFSFFPIVMIIVMAVFFGWFWAIAIGLQSKLPTEIRMNTTKFKIFFFIPLIYTLLICVVLGVVMVGMAERMRTGLEPNPGVVAGIMAVVFPIHLFSMFCIFYTMYFVAKTFRTAELQRETSFSDFAGEFFLIWFYPVGVWIIQPRVNKLLDNDNAVLVQG